MPLKSGSSRKVMEENFHELRHGKTYARTRRKFGKKKAQAQMEAIALKTAGKSRPRFGRGPMDKMAGRYH